MNRTISRYLDKNVLFSKRIEDDPDGELGMVIVIPAFNEPSITQCIDNLINCNPPKSRVEIIVSLNAGVGSPVDVKQRNLESYEKLIEIKSKTPSWLKLFPIMHNDLPDKRAGVGLGRKIGMDEAVLRFVHLEKENGIIVCFDADSKVDPNYLCEIESHFANSKVGSASIHYEHPIEGHEFSSEIYDAIIQYELHLRYFIRIQKRIHLPFAFHTVGSSMACTVSAYCAVGGMNQRKAGEDFYFIHKLVKYGKHSELNSTRVIPSPRISSRVPFGTGRAIGEMQESRKTIYNTYHPQSFLDLKVMVDGLPEVYKNQKFATALSSGLTQFLSSSKAETQLNRILKNTSDYPSFYRMFWHWFDAFVLMKYLHFVRDRYYPDLPVLEAVNQMVSLDFKTAKEALIYYREIDVMS